MHREWSAPLVLFQACFLSSRFHVRSLSLLPDLLSLSPLPFLPNLLQSWLGGDRIAHSSQAFQARIVDALIHPQRRDGVALAALLIKSRTLKKSVLWNGFLFCFHKSAHGALKTCMTHAVWNKIFPAKALLSIDSLVTRSRRTLGAWPRSLAFDDDPP